jgi:hypothetical protein
MKLTKIDTSNSVDFKNAWNSNSLNKGLNWDDIVIEVFDRRVECESLTWLDEETKRALDNVMKNE